MPLLRRNAQVLRGNRRPIACSATVRHPRLRKAIIGTADGNRKTNCMCRQQREFAHRTRLAGRVVGTLVVAGYRRRKSQQSDVKGARLRSGREELVSESGGCAPIERHHDCSCQISIIGDSQSRPRPAASSAGTRTPLAVAVLKGQSLPCTCDSHLFLRYCSLAASQAHKALTVAVAVA